VDIGAITSMDGAGSRTVGYLKLVSLWLTNLIHHSIFKLYRTTSLDHKIHSAISETRLQSEYELITRDVRIG